MTANRPVSPTITADRARVLGRGASWLAFAGTLLVGLPHGWLPVVFCVSVAAASMLPWRRPTQGVREVAGGLLGVAAMTGLIVLTGGVASPYRIALLLLLGDDVVRKSRRRLVVDAVAAVAVLGFLAVTSGGGTVVRSLAVELVGWGLILAMVGGIVAEIRDKSGLLGAIVDSTVVGILSIDTGGVICSWNRGAERVFGYDEEEVVGRPSSLLAAPGERGRLASLFDVCRAGRPASTDTVGRHRSGREIDVNLTMSPIHDAEGRLKAVSLIVKDVSDRRTAERALRDSEARLRLLAEHAHGYVYYLSLRPEVRVEYLSPRVEAVTGYSRDVHLHESHRIVEAVHPDDHGRWSIPQRLHAEEGTLLFRFRRPDGRWVWLEDHYGVLHDKDGAPFAIHGLVLDVSARQEAQRRLEQAFEQERDAAEALRTANDIQAAFLRAVSHELRTPLTSVMGFAQSLQQNIDRLGREQVTMLLDRLVANGARLGRLLDDLLDINRLSRGMHEIEPEFYDLARVADAALPNVELVGHELVTHLESAIVPLDTAVVERIVDNLVRNAVRHTPTGTTIWVSTAPRTDGGARLVVEDDGPGVPDALKEAIFEPFRQGPEAMQAPQPGTGIGLNLVTRFTQLHRGEVRVEDREEGGARFVVEFPPAPSGAAAPPPLAATA